MDDCAFSKKAAKNDYAGYSIFYWPVHGYILGSIDVFRESLPQAADSFRRPRFDLYGVVVKHGKPYNLRAIIERLG